MSLKFLGVAFSVGSVMVNDETNNVDDACSYVGTVVVRRVLECFTLLLYHVQSTVHEYKYQFNQVDILVSLLLLLLDVGNRFSLWCR